MVGSPIEEPIEKVCKQLRARGLRLQLHFWFSSEWFTPDGTAGIAIPFHLAHPRLMQLERTVLKGTAIETPALCRKILRHEAGHALENAFRLRRRAAVQQVFGSSSIRYPRYYTPQPYSRKFVQHLGVGYAQSHPDEDFAETFAVWLGPKSQWRAKYAGWPALRKLEFMDSLMQELAGERPALTNRRSVEPLRRLDLTLRTYYRRLRRHLQLDVPEIDQSLHRILSRAAAPHASVTADAFLRKIKPKLRSQVALLSGHPKHQVDRVVNDLIRRSRHFPGHVSPTRWEMQNGVPTDFTRHALRALRTGLHRIAL